MRGIRGFHLILLLTARLLSEQLPIRSYSTADGLPNNRIHHITADSHGFIWFSTGEGLARFDGYGFTTYGVQDGLPNRSVYYLLETREGDYWVATGKGIVRFRPDGAGAIFDTPLLPGPAGNPTVTQLYQDRRGSIWAATGNGLFGLTHKGANWRLEDMHVPKLVDSTDGFSVQALLDDPSGALWVGASSGLYRVWPDGRTERSTTAQGLPQSVVQSLLRDSRNRIWVATRGGLCLLMPLEGGGPARVERVYGEAQGLAHTEITSLTMAPDGSIWAGGLLGGVSRLPPDFPDRPLRTFSTRHGLTDGTILSVAVDRAGNMWLGSDGSGAMKIARHGFSAFTEADGLADARITALFEDREGVLYAIANRNATRAMNRFNGERFTALYPNLKQQHGKMGWGWAQLILQDRAGAWWIATGEGLARFSQMPAERLSSALPAAVYFPLGSEQAFRVFEDSRGSIWSSMYGSTNRLGRKDRGAAAFTYLSTSLDPPEPLVTAFAEDHSGNVWMGFYGGHVARYSNGRFTNFFHKDGIPEGLISDLFVDHAGRLWIAGNDGGLGRVDAPNDLHPQFVGYDSGHGLGSNAVYCATEDIWGRIYVGHGRGIDRLDPTTGRIRHYTTADGLPLGRPSAAFRDRSGALWFGTTHGLARLEPTLDAVRDPPPVLLTSLRIAGVERRISQLGEARITGLQLRADQRDIQVDFVGLSYEPGEILQYEYKIDSGSGNWIQLGGQRRITFANLRSGRYLFSVRALGSDGVTSLSPATISFEVLPPYWQRWWFEALIALLIAATSFAAYRYRIGRLLALERMRTRIATDLHDDIGSSLTQIAILSEVARRTGREEGLSRIAAISRELVDSMSDIVWTINPRKDSLDDLVWRMRQFAGEMFVSRDIAFTFQAPEDGRHMHLSADLRRQVFLVFKECLTNAVRHSACTEAAIHLRIEHHTLVLILSENGCGFNPLSKAEGHGLVSMKTRASELGGNLEIDTSSLGTVIKLRAPLS